MSEWISVNDELPEFHTEVLFYAGDRDGWRIGAFYANSHKFISDGDKFYKSDVTHWQHLVKPISDDT